MNGKATAAFEEAESAVMNIITKTDVGEEEESYFYRLMMFHLSVVGCDTAHKKIRQQLDDIQEKGCNANIKKLEFFAWVVEDSLTEMTEILRLEMVHLHDTVCETAQAQRSTCAKF